MGIFVKKNISSYKIDLQTPLQAVAVSIKCHVRVTVCSLYLPPGDNIQLDQLQALMDQLPKPFMILGDMNAHHPMWHDPRPTDPRGETIVNFIERNDIALLDKNKMTSIWKVDKTFSHIDLSICSSELLPWFHWDVYEEPLNSDHFPILIKSGIQRNVGGTARWIMNQAKWDVYKANTENEKDIEEFSSVDEAANFFEKHIKEAATKSIPRSKGTRRRKSPPWWNQKCRAAICKRKAAFRRYTRVSSRANYDKFSKARAEAKRTVKQSKREAWENFINSINMKSTTKEIWKKIHMLNNRHKSDMVTTLILNKKEIKITNIPLILKEHLVETMCKQGCVQTLHEEHHNPRVCTISIRFETDEATNKALELDGTEIEGHTIKVELVEQNQQEEEPKVLDDPKEIADCLGKRFSHISSENSSPQIFKEHKDRTEKVKLDFNTREKKGYNRPFNMEELEFALKDRKDSAPGQDEIYYSMLKNLAPSGKQLLLDLMNRVLKDSKFPVQWKESLIIPILKEGKLATNSSSYRPIALTSCVCKLLEKMVDRRLRWFLESKGHIDKCQSGFRRGRSTTDCLASLATEAQDAFRKKQYLLCVFFDLEKAYDTCWKHLIMKELHKFGLRGELAKLIEDYLTNRKFRVKVDSSLSEQYTQEMGVPQGGVLSCTLFNIAINTAVAVIKGLVSYSLYVDDKRIAYAHTSIDICRRMIQRALNALHKWSLETGFRFSTDKTEWMIFYSYIQAPTNTITLTLNDKVLKQVTTKKFLGLIFDRLLNWQNHVSYLRGKTMSALNIIQVISRCNRGTDSKTLLRIYRAIVRSKLDYGCQVYGTETSYLDPLDPVHHKGIRVCIGAYRSSPIDSLYVEANEPSLKVRRQILQLQYYARMKQFPPDRVPLRLDDTSLDGEYSRPSTKPVTLGYRVRQAVTRLDLNIPNIALLTESKLGPWELPTPKVCMELAKYPKSSTTDEKYLQHFLSHKHTSDIDIYTDGSKSDNCVGSGVAIIKRGKVEGSIKRRLHETATVFTAELFAIKLALISLKTSRGITCTIYSDSRSALQAIQNQSLKSMVMEILELYKELGKRGICITLCWIPGHAGISGNDLADHEAKEATDLNVISTQDIPVSDVKSYMKRKVIDKWKLDWENKAEPNKLKEICPTVKGTPLNLGLTRKDSWKLTRLRIGHTRLTHSFHFTGEDMGICVECEVPMSVKHILIECGNFALQRLQHYDPREVTLKELLTNRELVLEVLQFLKDIDWYNDI